jgi:excinuclease ABC subunit A
MSSESLIVKGARVHNLKNINCEIPHNSLTVITGVSGSGKSSLAFDTIYAEGQRRYIESLSAYARQFLERMEKPDVEEIEGIAPAIAIRQKNAVRNPRSTVATVTEVYDYLRLLFARVGRTICLQCHQDVKKDEMGEVAQGSFLASRDPNLCSFSVFAYRKAKESRQLAVKTKTRKKPALAEDALREVLKDLRERISPSVSGAENS